MIDGTAEAAQRAFPQAEATADAASRAHRVGWPLIMAYGLAYAGLWMALLPPILVSLVMRVHEIVPAHATGSLSLMVGMGALLALLGNPFFGRLPDRTASRFGMRRPWLIVGALRGTAGLAVLAQAGSVPQLLPGWCVTQLAYNAQLATLAAILADQVPSPQRGTVSGMVGSACRWACWRVPIW